MSLGGQLLYLCYLLFLLSMVIVGLVFLTDQISENKALLPNFNNTMYNFLYVGLWIIVGVTAIELLVGMFAAGYAINSMVSLEQAGDYVVVPRNEAEKWNWINSGSELRQPRGRGRKLARKAERRRAASR